MGVGGRVEAAVMVEPAGTRVRALIKQSQGSALQALAPPGRSQLARVTWGSS